MSIYFLFKKIPITLYMLLTFLVSFSQIQPNEKLIYAASYSMSGLMTNLAQITMETEKINTSKKTFLHLSIIAATFSKWDTYFKIRDLYESYVDPVTLKPSLYKRSVEEGSYTKTEKYVFNSDGKIINSTAKRKNKHETKKTLTISSSTQDIVSIIYKLRMVDFRNFKNGQTKSFIVVFDEKEYPVAVKFLGKEKVSVGNLGIKECYKISIAAKTNVLKGEDKNLIWLTADAEKIPALIKFNIPVGTGQLTLSNASRN